MEDVRDLPGQTVLMKLTHQEELAFAGIPDDGPFFCAVTGVDQYGLWVENKRFVTVEVQDSKGKYIPKTRQKPKRHVVDILFPWRNIQTVVRFAEEDLEGMVGERIGQGDKTIGKIGFIK
jgi:hypothetical protein